MNENDNNNKIMKEKDIKKDISKDDMDHFNRSHLIQIVFLIAEPSHGVKTYHQLQGQSQVKYRSRRHLYRRKHYPYVASTDPDRFLISVPSHADKTHVNQLKKQSGKDTHHIVVPHANQLKQSSGKDTHHIVGPHANQLK
eukprot:820276_1